MHMDDRVSSIAAGEKRRELRLRGRIPQPLRAETHERRGRESVRLVEQYDLDASLDQAWLSRADRREEYHAMAAPRQPHGAVDRHLCRAAVDMGVVVDDDDAHYLTATT